jgi:hypothetical protein
MDDTSGFYKNDEGALLFGPNFVESRDFKLERAKHTEYTYPVQGWSWFDSEARPESISACQRGRGEARHIALAAVSSPLSSWSGSWASSRIARARPRRTPHRVGRLEIRRKKHGRRNTMRLSKLLPLILCLSLLGR